MISLPFAVVGQPLFGNVWLALLAVLALIALFMVAVALVGRWLAATHPDPVHVPRPVVVPVAADELSPETMAILACAVCATLGPGARIAGITQVPAPSPSVEALMLQWSLEGRRQIYTSHKVR